MTKMHYQILANGRVSSKETLIVVSPNILLHLSTTPLLSSPEINRELLLKFH